MECYDFSRLDPETLVTCPFDEVHRVSVKRLVRHLIKCSKNNNTSNYKFCPYTYLHVVPASELESHVARCEYRKLVENQMQQDPAPKGGYTELPVSSHSSSWKPTSTGEDWDDEGDEAHTNFEFTHQSKPAYNQRLPEQIEDPPQRRLVSHPHPPAKEPQYRDYRYYPAESSRPVGTQQQQQSSQNPQSQQRVGPRGRGMGVLGLPRQPRSNDHY